MEHTPREPGSEEYLGSEKYEVRHWDIARSDSLRDVITLVNKARRENIALQTNGNLEFHDIDNPQLIAYSKRTDDNANIVICIVNLDPHNTQSGWVTLPIDRWNIEADAPYQVHDLIADARYTWHGARNYVQLNPHQLPAHIFRLRRKTGGRGWEFE
jgi:starch synthase (maltosyl-transferring)